MSTTTRSVVLALAITTTTFAAPEKTGAEKDPLPLPGVPTAAVVTDVDRDGVLDVLVAVEGGPRLVLLRGDASGAFAPAVATASMSKGWRSSA